MLTLLLGFNIIVNGTGKHTEDNEANENARIYRERNLLKIFKSKLFEAIIERPNL